MAYGSAIYGTTTYGAPPPPAAPSGLSATAVSAGQINLAWTDNASSETGFVVQRRLGAGAYSDLVSLPGNTTSYQDQSVSPATSYTYRVRAENAGGASAYSNEATATTPAGLAAPTNLVASSIGATSVTLSWQDTTTTETGFQLERQAPGEGGFSLLTTFGPNTTSYTDSPLTPSATYLYRVRAVGAGPTYSGYSNTLTVFTNAAPPPATGVGTVVVRDGATTIATLPYAPNPITWEDDEPVAYALNGAPQTGLWSVVELPYAFTEQRIATILFALPTDRELDWFLPVKTSTTNEHRWTWVRGWLVRPTRTTYRNRRDWTQTPWRLVGAREV